MYSRVQLDRFRGFRRLDLPELSRITLLSGRNNTGKSAVLEALFLLACGPTSGQVSAATLRAFRGEPQSAIDPSGESTPWDEIFYNFDTSMPAKLSCLQDRVPYSLEFEIPAGAREQYLPISGIVGGNYSRELLIREQRASQDETLYSSKLEVQLPPLQQGFSLQPQIATVAPQFSLNPSPKYPPGAGFLIGSRLRANQQELAGRYSQLRRRGNQKELVSALRQIEPRLDRLEVITDRGGQPLLHFEMGEEGPLYPITVLGEGVTSLTDMITSINLARNGVVLIDEIENGIHHSVLKDMWSHLQRAAERADAQVVATTHSQECVEAAHSAMMKRPDQLKVYRLRRPKRIGDVEAIGYDNETLSGALSGGLDIR